MSTTMNESNGMTTTTATLSLPIAGQSDPAGGGCCGGDTGGGCGCSSGGTSVYSGAKIGPGGYWRSLDEFKGEERFTAEFLNREFPVAASEYPEGVSRRRWMQLMGASVALAGAAGCRYPEENILPFVIRPEGRIPGEPYYRATNFELAGRVYNLLVQCIDGRPLKIEPNPQHPSGTGTDVFSQASMLSLYDPDRTRGTGDNVVLTQGDGVRGKKTWDDFFGAAGEVLSGDGSKAALMMPPTASPSVVRMVKKLQNAKPGLTLCRFEPVEGDATRKATADLFGTPCSQYLTLENAKVIVTVQADILGSDRGMVRTAAGFHQTRDPGAASMSRLYAVEGNYSTTGSSADVRLALRPSQARAFVADLARRVEKLRGGESHDHGTPETAFDEISAKERYARFVDQVAHDIADAGDGAVVIVGDALGPEAVADGIRMNQSLGSLGKLQRFREDVDAELEPVDIGELTTMIDAGDVDTVIAVEGNPLFAAPSDLKFGDAWGKLKTSVYLSEYDDETSFLSDWSLPLAHPLESWGDCVSDDGYYGVCQPQILPLLGGRSVGEVLAALAGERVTDGESIVRETAEDMAGSLSDRQWRQLLHDGYAEDMRREPVGGAPQGDGEDTSEMKVVVDINVDRSDLEVVFVPADGIYDGRFANNGWLQELPQTLTKMTWDNAAIMSPRTAEALGVGHGRMVALTYGDATVELPVYEIPGCAPGVVTVPIGYGRTRAGRIGGLTEFDIDPVGVDVSPLRTRSSMQIAYGVRGVQRAGDYDLATTQNHWAIDELGREETEARSFTLVREGTTALLEKVPEFAEAKGPHVPKVGKTGSPWNEVINEIERNSEGKYGDGGLKGEHPEDHGGGENAYGGDEGLLALGTANHQWGMSIDLSKCTGCNACVIACQSENNVPIVGREQVMKSREMHWLRVDRYFQSREPKDGETVDAGYFDNADVVQQPVACMHCETAPCEQVCPVAATVHTNEGINAMAYNRCIGTRYCANNCPFKVRRFNYFNYNEEVGVGYGWNAFPGHIEEADRKLEQLVLNPEVTVRGRGVMEKCTYCTQRVEKAKIKARKESNGIVPDGGVVVACQSACPHKAIEFGNLFDDDSVVSEKHRDVRSYGMLAQLNVKPRTEYLARVRNTPPSLMTRAQMNDLAMLEAPHHGHDDHGGNHGHDNHGHDDHHEEGEKGHDAHHA